MDGVKYKSFFVNQLFLVSGVLSTVLSCGLGLGFLSIYLDNAKNDQIGYPDEKRKHFMETAGELAFVPSIVVIPFAMQKKGRRVAFMATTIALLLSWLTSFGTHFTARVIFNVLHNTALGGTASVSSIMIGEYCTPKYRGTFLMLETVMISLGVLFSHVLGMNNYFHIVSTLGGITALYSLIVINCCPESPYWLISQGRMAKCTESFQWLRGHDDEALQELESILQKYRLKQQLEARGPVQKPTLRNIILSCFKTLLRADFLKPLSIMILLLSFVGFGGENLVSSYSLRDIFHLTNEKYIGTIVLDVLSLVCSLTACVLLRIVRRKSLFLFTGSCSILFLALTSLVIFLQSLDIFHRDFLWIFLCVATGFVMFMSLGTAALPFAMLGEIFPMSYKGIGSSLTCAYLWASGNTLVRFVPYLTEIVGAGGMLVITIVVMTSILLILSLIMPDTNTKSLLEIEELFRSKKKDIADYVVVASNENEDCDPFEKLRLWIDVC